MNTRLSKFGWEEKIKMVWDRISDDPITDKDLKSIWWVLAGSYSMTSGMRLTKIGYEWLKLAEVQFNKYECHVPTWSGALLLGLSKMPCPYYIESENKTGNPMSPFMFCIPDDEYAMLLMFTNNDLVMFAKSFLLS